MGFRPQPLQILDAPPNELDRVNPGPLKSYGIKIADSLHPKIVPPNKILPAFDKFQRTIPALPVVRLLQHRLKLHLITRVHLRHKFLGDLQMVPVRDFRDLDKARWGRSPYRHHRNLARLRAHIDLFRNPLVYKRLPCRRWRANWGLWRSNPIGFRHRPDRKSGVEGK